MLTKKPVPAQSIRPKDISRIPAPSIKVMIEMPPPAPQGPQVPVMDREKDDRPCIEDQVREALDCIDSGYESHVEWLMIGGLYRKLKQLARPSPRALNLIEMIEPVLSKYGYHKVAPSPKG